MRLDLPPLALTVRGGVPAQPGAMWMGLQNELGVDVPTDGGLFEDWRQAQAMTGRALKVSASPDAIPPDALIVELTASPAQPSSAYLIAAGPGMLLDHMNNVDFDLYAPDGRDATVLVTADDAGPRIRAAMESVAPEQLWVAAWIHEDAADELRAIANVVKALR